MLLFIIILFSTHSNTQINGLTEVKIPDPDISVWNFDDTQFPITSAQTHPYTVDGNIGRAQIVLLSKINGYNLPIIVNFVNGFMTIDILNNVYFQVNSFSFNTELLVIGSNVNSTSLIWKSPLHKEYKITLSSTLINTKAYFDISNRSWIIQGYDGLNNVEIKWNGLTYEKKTSKLFIIDTWQNYALVHTNNSIWLYGDLNPIRVNVSNNTVIGHSGFKFNNFFNFNLTLFDLNNHLATILKSNKSYQIPTQTEKIFRFGSNSSFIQTSNGSLYSYFQNQSTLIQTKGKFLDISFIDKSLLLSITMFRGLAIRYYGIDSDNDGLPDVSETYYQTQKDNPDSDGDSINDLSEVAFGTNPNLRDTELDLDNDGLTNLNEFIIGTSPRLADTDFGGAPDGWEIKYKLDPLLKADDLQDLDNDGLINSIEGQINTNPLKADSDNDGIPDGWEYTYNLNPLNSSDSKIDIDLDGYSNLNEFLFNQNPRIKDNRFPFAPEIFIPFLVILLPSALFAIFILRRKIIKIL